MSAEIHENNWAGRGDTPRSLGMMKTPPKNTRSLLIFQGLTTQSPGSFLQHAKTRTLFRIMMLDSHWRLTEISQANGKLYSLWTETLETLITGNNSFKPCSEIQNVYLKKNNWKSTGATWTQIRTNRILFRSCGRRIHWVVNTMDSRICICYSRHKVESIEKAYCLETFWLIGQICWWDSWSL